MTSKILNNENMLPSEETCMNMFRSIRWSLGVYCPKCNSYDIHNRGSPFKTPHYSCKKCVLNFSDYTGTIFHKTKVSMNVIFYILFNLPFKSVNMIFKELSYTRKTITRIANLIRENLENNYISPKLSGDIEFDEMYIAAGNKGVKKTPQRRSSTKKGLRLRGRGTYEKDKPPIIPIILRTTGKVIFKVVPNRSNKLIRKLISEYCDKPVQVFSDNYTIYNDLSSHELVIHHMGKSF